MARFPFSPASWATTFVSCLAIINTIIPTVAAQDDRTISGTDADGVTRTLLVDRTPALFTGDFGDCMGGNSLMNITSFDAAYYADNMTVLFNLAGTSNLLNQSLMCMYTTGHGLNRLADSAKCTFRYKLMERIDSTSCGIHVTQTLPGMLSILAL